MSGTRIARRRRRVSVFYIIYFLCLIIAAVLIVLTCSHVRKLLAEYEAVQPKHLAEEVFEAYFSPIDYDRLLADARYDAGLAGDAAVRAYLDEQIGGEALAWSMGSSGEADTLRYIVKAGAKQIGAIYLTTAETVTEHGFQTYRLEHIELSLDYTLIPTGTLTVTAPADYTVILDGAALTAEEITSTFVDPDALDYYPAGVSGVEFAVYTVSGLHELPREVSVTSPEGEAAAVTFDAQTNSYAAGIAYSTALAEEYSPFVIKAVEGYAAYMQNVPHTSWAGIRGYFDPDSALYAAIRAAAGDLWMVKEPTGNDFRDVRIGEFYPFPDGVFSCHISFTQVLHRSGTDHTDAIDMIVFLRPTDNGYRIYEWYNNS